jgi:hypothetical protein
MIRTWKTVALPLLLLLALPAAAQKIENKEDGWFPPLPPARERMFRALAH